MTLQLTLIFNGIVAGSVFLLFTMPFTLLYGTFRAINLAQGAILTFGGFIGIYFDNHLHTSLAISIICAALASGVLTAALDGLLLRPVARNSQLTTTQDVEFGAMIVTTAFGTIVTGLLMRYEGDGAYTFTGGRSLAKPAFGIVSWLNIVLLALAVVTMAGLYYTTSRTRAGMRIRAVAEDRTMSAALGIRPGGVSLATFFVAGCATGAAGVLIGVEYSGINVSIGDTYLILAFIIATVGGLGSVAGTAVASIAIGIIQQFGGAHLSTPGVTLVLNGLLFLTLVIRPSGLFGKQAVTYASRRV